MNDDRTHTYLYQHKGEPWAVRASSREAAVSALRGTLGHDDLAPADVVSVDGADDALAITWPDTLAEHSEGQVYRVRPQPDPVVLSNPGELP